MCCNQGHVWRFCRVELIECLKNKIKVTKLVDTRFVGKSGWKKVTIEPNSFELIQVVMELLRSGAHTQLFWQNIFGKLLIWRRFVFNAV